MSYSGPGFVRRAGVALLGSAGALALVVTACSSETASTPTPVPSQPTATARVSPTATAVPASNGTASTPTGSPRPSVNPCPQRGVKELTGAGATFPFPLYSKMFDEYNKLCGVKVNYQSIGSGGGIQQVQRKTVDFGGSDAIMTAEQKAQAQGGAVLHIPIVAGAEAVVVNLAGVQRGQLKLTTDVLADIYLKKIAKWTDPRITAINPGLNLPNVDIAVVHRSDGSGTTFIFTNYLAKVSKDWSDKVGFATSVNWPGDIGGPGNEGVANQVRQIPGAIGYVELAYALQNNLVWAQIRNKAGTFLEPGIDVSALATDVPNLPDTMEVLITDSDNPGAYPIVGFTWALVYVNQTDAAKADAVTRLVWWMTHDAQQYAIPLQYVPLKGQAIAKTEALIRKVNVGGQPVLQ